MYSLINTVCINININILIISQVLGIAEQTEKNLDDNIVHSLKPSKKALVLLKSMWEQTAPLFKMPLILKTVMTCSLQFGVFAS